MAIITPPCLTNPVWTDYIFAGFPEIPIFSHAVPLWSSFPGRAPVSMTRRYWMQP